MNFVYRMNRILDYLISIIVIEIKRYKQTYLNFDNESIYLDKEKNIL